MQLANMLTLSRLACVLPLVLLVHAEAFTAAFYVFFLAALSDAADGAAARMTGHFSTFGAALDPVADKALLAGALVSLWLVDLVPGWFILVLMLRDLAILASTVTLYLSRRALHVEPLVAGKISTALQLVLVGLLLFEHGFGVTLSGLVEIGFPAVACVAMVSLGLYGVNAWRANGVAVRNAA